MHDIELRVRVDFATKTYSDSEGTWTIDDEGDSISYTFEFYVDSDDVIPEEIGDVNIRAEFKENVAFASDPEYDTGWGNVGEVEILKEPVFEPAPEEPPPEETTTPEETPSRGFCLGTLLVIAIPIVAFFFKKRNT